MKRSLTIFFPALFISSLFSSCADMINQENTDKNANQKSSDTPAYPENTNMSANGDNANTNLPVLLSREQTDASCVFLTKDENNNPLISWVETDKEGTKHFYFSNWNAVAGRFDPGIPIPIEPIATIHEEGMPKLAVKGDGTLVAIYETSVPSPKSRFGISDIRFSLSFDKGKTWTAQSSIQPYAPAGSSRSFCNIIRLDDGEVGAAWLDTNPDNEEGGRPVKFAKTTKDGGFGTPLLIEPFACQCCRTALSSNGSGNVSVVFRDLLSGSVRDISVSKSFDNGQTFSPCTPFSNDNWVIDGCPHNGPSVAGKDDRIYVTWFTGAHPTGVYYAELDGNHQLKTKRRLDANGRFSQLCLMPGGDRIVAFNKSYRENDSLYSRIIVNKINQSGVYEKEITPVKVYATFPVVQPAGKDQVIVAWSGGGRVCYTLAGTNTITLPANEEKSIAFGKLVPLRCCN